MVWWNAVNRIKCKGYCYGHTSISFLTGFLKANFKKLKHGKSMSKIWFPRGGQWHIQLNQSQDIIAHTLLYLQIKKFCMCKSIW